MSDKTTMLHKSLRAMRLLEEAEAERGPTHWRTTLADGTQVLVTFWGDGSAEMATRQHPRDIWGAPVEMTRADESGKRAK